MKIPKYEKDRTLTRRTVKGAAGGLKGVHYEDDRRPDASTKLSPEASRIQKFKNEQIRADRRVAAAAARALAHAPAAETEKTSPPKEEQEMILDDEDAMSRDTKARKKRRPVVARDRFTVDKDAPDRRRKVRWDLLLEDDADDEPDEESAEIDLGAIADAVFGGRGRRFSNDDEQSYPGAPGLLMPDEIQAAFGSPFDYAKHCMLLAETFAQSTGALREEAVRYLAALFLGLSDRRFGRRALLAWGPDTGILDVYPLEVIEHVLETQPEFLPRVRFGRWIAPELGEAPQSELTVAADLPLFLTVPEDVMVRGFAIKGGDRPGYCFEPGPDLATYALSLGSPGRYRLLMSARTPQGDTLVDRLQVRVLGPPAPARPRPARNPERVAAWPMPVVPIRVDAPPEAEDDDPETSGRFARHEFARRQTLDALGGPKGEAADALFGLGRSAATDPIHSGRAAMPSPLLPLEAPEDARLSAAEAAVLKLALAAGATMADVQIAEAEPTDSEEVTDVLPVWPDTAVEVAYGAAAAMAELAQQALANEPARLGAASTEDFVAADTPWPPPAEPVSGRLDPAATSALLDAGRSSAPNANAVRGRRIAPTATPTAPADHGLEPVSGAERPPTATAQRHDRPPTAADAGRSDHAPSAGAPARHDQSPSAPADDDRIAPTRTDKRGLTASAAPADRPPSDDRAPAPGPPRFGFADRRTGGGAGDEPRHHRTDGGPRWRRYDSGRARRDRPAHSSRFGHPEPGAGRRRSDAAHRLGGRSGPHPVGDRLRTAG